MLKKAQSLLNNQKVITTIMIVVALIIGTIIYISRNGVSAATVSPVKHNPATSTISSTYAFTPDFSYAYSHYSSAITLSGTDSTNKVDTFINEFQQNGYYKGGYKCRYWLLDISNNGVVKGKTSATIKNVGEDADGNQLDMKITIMDWAYLPNRVNGNPAAVGFSICKPVSFTTSSGQQERKTYDLNFERAGMAMSETVKIEYLQNNTAVQVGGHYSIYEVDNDKTDDNGNVILYEYLIPESGFSEFWTTTNTSVASAYTSGGYKSGKGDMSSDPDHTMTLLFNSKAQTITYGRKYDTYTTGGCETNEGVAEKRCTSGASMSGARTSFNITTKKPIKRVNDKTSETITGTSSFTYSVKQYVPYNLAKYNNTALTSAITGFSFSDTLKDGLVIDSVSDITVENMTGTDVTSTYFNITLSSDKRTATATLKPAKVSDTTFYGQHYIMKIKAHAKSGYTKWTDYLSNGKITVPNTATTTFTRGSGNDSKNSNTVNVNLNIPVTVNYQIVGTAPSEAPAAPASETKNIGDAYTTKSKLSDGVYNNKKCTFSGWNTKNDNGTLSGTWTNGTALKENLTLYGKWNCADPVIVNYNITSTDNPPVSTISINKSKPDNVGVGTVYVGDKYTAEPELTTTWKKKKCTFTGWTTDNTLNTKWAANTTLATTNLTKNASIDGYELNLYGGWSCEKLVLDPTKTVNDKQQIEIEADEKFTFTITHNVPNITDSHFYYDKYVVTDQLEPALKIREVDIKDKNGSDLNDFFTVTIAGQKVTITANNDYLANPSFYNQTYNFMIIASKRDGADLTNYLQTNGEYEIPNKAAIEINEDAINKTTLETNEVKLKVKKFDIKYHVIGDVNPPANLTDPLPADTKALSGSAYNQENKLTTTYIEKKCTFNGWYLDEGFTKKWIDGDKVNSNLDFYGSWQCDNVVNDINKTATLDKIVGTQNFEYTIYQTVPNLEEAFYYKNYEIIDALEPVLETEKDNINVYVGETKVTDKFNIEVSGQTVTITAKDTTSADFYNKEYKYVITVNKKDGADLTDYQEGDTYIIPNKAHLKVKTAADTTEEKDSNEVKKEIGKVTVDYQIIGTNNPDSSLTDPIPSSVTFLAGEKYKAASPLTTRYTTKTCTFNGWYTDTKLQNKYQDDSVVNEDMTLYGSWDCIEIVNVPPTSSFVSKVLLVIGVLLVAAAAIMIYTTAKEKKVNQG